MTATVLVVGQTDWDDPTTVTAALEGTTKRFAGEGLSWATLGQTGPEQVTESWVMHNRMHLHPVVHLGNKYLRLNHVLRTVVPDLVLTFGVSNVVSEAAHRARLYGIRHVSIP